MAEAYALLVFLIVYTLIAVRRVKDIIISAWIPMLIGALLMLMFQTISIEDAYKAIKVDVITFLIGMFIIVAALERSGALNVIIIGILKHVNNTKRLLLFIIVILGTLSAFLMNDTIALVATPIILNIARFGIEPKLLLIALAFAVTIGSTMTPIGNPQNLLIAIESGMKAPMLDFLKYLTLPTIANYIATYYLLRWYYRDTLRKDITFNIDAIKVTYEPNTIKINIIIVSLVIIGFFVVTIARVIGFELMFDISHIAIIGGLIMLICSKDRLVVLKHVNWGIIILFISMFIFMDALAKAGIIAMFADMLSPLQFVDNNKTSISTILSIISASTLLSQFMSNVPFVAFYINIMHEHGFSSEDIKAWVTLAGASTLAGNMTILGAASNLIILEAARREGFTFIEFFKIGSMVTAINMLILVTFLLIIP